MADYRYAGENVEDGVFLYSKNMQIPNNHESLNWRQYQEYVAGGGETDPFRTTEETMEANSMIALEEQNVAINNLLVQEQRTTLGLPPTMTEQEQIEQKNYINYMQGEIDNPSDDPVYSPPLPPGVNPPPHETIVIAVERVAGWQDILGYEAIITSQSPDFVPTNLALSVYTAEECSGYLYTTGAFVWDAVRELWTATCPAGQEPGDVDIHFGALYGAAELACFTLGAGIEAQVYNIYEEV